MSQERGTDYPKRLPLSGLGISPHVPTHSPFWTPNYLASVLLIILQPLLQEMQPLGALLAGRAMLHNSSHREGMVHVGKHLLIQILGTG